LKIEIKYKAKRKASFAIILILCATACKKNANPTVSSGSWTFQSVTYYDTKGLPGIWGNEVISILAKNSSHNYPWMSITNNRTQSFVTGSYYVEAGSGISANYSLNIEVVDSSGNAYLATGDSTQTVSVSVSNNTISLSGSGIKMVNFSLTDTSLLTFNITQTQ
jgi:hypothetical protein